MPAAYRFELARLESHHIVELGARLRRIADGGGTSPELAARPVIELLHEALLDAAGEPALSEVRAYRNRTLLAATGSADATIDLAEVFRALGAVPGAAALDQGIGVYFVPGQIIAFGSPLPGGDVFAVLLFIHEAVAVEERVARAFETLGLHLRAALLGTAPDTAWARAAALERLLRLHEYEAIKRTAVPVLDGRGAVAEASRLERTQRAMLNVIDDLRSARTSLELRVAERTAELSRTNDELEKSNRELEEFAYVASHDLQEPLRTIVGYLQLIDQRYRDRLDDEAREFIAFAVSGAERMQALIDGLLSYSRVTTKVRPFERVALGRVLDEVLASLGAALEKSHATVERDDLPEVRGDRLQLGQLLQNLLSNALKFAGDKPPHVEVRCARADGTWHIAVRDHGIGFDGRHAESVFRVFRRLQRKYPGTGVGLAICKKVVERHGGAIRAEAAVGHGATFTFTLPVTEGTT